MYVASGAMNIAYSQSTNGGSVKFASRTVHVAAGGTISAHAAGFRGGVASGSDGWGYGPGRGFNGGGGGYGAAGAVGGYGGTAGATYGSSNAPPVYPGSGGGNHNTSGGGGGRGGGLVWIEAEQTVTLDGLLTANGQGPRGQSAAGSGGGIFVWCRKFQGAGTAHLEARGGDGGTSGPPGGAGGGGRIQVWRKYDLGFSGTTSVLGGTGTYPSTAGTVFFGDIPIPAGTVIRVW